MVKIESCMSEACSVGEDVQKKLRETSLADYFAKRKGGQHCYVFWQDGKVVGTMTEQQARDGAPMTEKWFRLGPNMFLEAREWYRDHEAERGQRFLALDDDGNAAGVLHWESVTYRFGTGVRNYDQLLWDYDFQHHLANEHLLNRASVYVFHQLEEYSHAISSYILQYYPERKIYFTDIKAELPVWKNDNKPIILRNWRNLPQGELRMYIDITISWMQRMQQPSWIPQFVNLSYNSQEVLWSMIFGSHLTHPGNLHPDRKVAILDNFHPIGGLCDINTLMSRYAFALEQQGFTPVVDQNEKSQCSLYTPGKDTWTTFFQPMSDISVEEAGQCKNVVRATDEGGWMWTMDTFDPYYIEASQCIGEDGINRKSHLSEESWRFVLNHVPEVLKPSVEKMKNAEIKGEKWISLPREKGRRILGVSVRGTGYRPETNNLPNSWNAHNANLGTMIAWVRSILASGDYSHFFLATEDEEYFNEFHMHFGKSMLHVDRTRKKRPDGGFYRYDLSPSNLARIRNFGGKREEQWSYLTEMKCLAICDDFISSMRESGAYRFPVRWNEGHYGFNKVLGDNPLAPLSNRVARVDFFNVGVAENKVEVISKAPDNALRVDWPSCFQTVTGVGCIIHVVGEQCDCMKVRIKCVHDGKFRIDLRGIDYVWIVPGKRLPLWITYTALLVNNDEILEKPVDVWVNEPFTYARDVQDGEELDVEIRWRSYHYAPQEMSSLLQQMI